VFTVLTLSAPSLSVLASESSGGGLEGPDNDGPPKLRAMALTDLILADQETAVDTDEQTFTDI